MGSIGRKVKAAAAIAQGVARDPRVVKLAARSKERAELGYWMIRRAEEGALTNAHYRALFTEGFGLNENFFTGKRILDVGCGPRGSLEWATMAAERVGLDPLSRSYLRMGGGAHAMRYVEGEIEDPPLPSEHFDVVSTINSLDHVNNRDRAINGLHRVLAPGGTLLVLTELNHAPRITEPQDFAWEIVEQFAAQFEVVDRLDLELVGGMMESVRAGVRFAHSDRRKRDGLLRLVLRK